MRMIESDKVIPLMRLLLLFNPKADAICKDMQEVVDIHTIDAVPVEAVAQMFLDFTGDKCPCNFNNNDEWLPLVCEYEAEGKCPDPDDMLGCWKQYIKHYGERKDGEG